MKRGNWSIVVASLLAVILTTTPEPSRGSEPTGLPSYLYDRGDGIPYTGDNNFFGKVIHREFLVFFAYAFNDSLAVEFESALHSSIDFRKDPSDNSNVPGRIRESGLGDTETNIRWRFQKETEARPEVTFFFKSVFPLQKDKKLLGTQDWEFSPGVVLTKGFSFGTLALKLSAIKLGERGDYAIDYVKRLSQNWRVVLSLEALGMNGHSSAKRNTR